MNPTTMSRHSNGAPVASTAEFSSYAIVHRDHAGFVIGAGGATVKDIAAKTNTWIHIQPVNEFSFGHPWFLIKGRSEDGVAKAHHYIMTISNEAEIRNPRWSVTQQMDNIPDSHHCGDTNVGYDNDEPTMTIDEYRFKMSTRWPMTVEEEFPEIQSWEAQNKSSAAQ
jgi:hypothetical protein